MALTNFLDKTGIITGGASGIGLATAHALYAEGANVVLADTNEQGLREAEERLKRHSPGARGQIVCIPTDVTREEEVRELMAMTITLCKGLDLVITSAGIGRGGPIDTFSSGDMRQLMEVNFIGTFHCIQQALPFMRRQNSGYFVCLSSVAGKLGTPLLAGYCASKWAVRGFTSAVRAELEGSGIGITTVYPSWVDTPMIHQENDALANMAIEALLTPEQVAAAILQAVREEKRDLTLAPNPDISAALQLYSANPEMAERAMGQHTQQALASQAARQA